MLWTPWSAAAQPNQLIIDETIRKSTPLVADIAPVFHGFPRDLIPAKSYKREGETIWIPQQCSITFLLGARLPQESVYIAGRHPKAFRKDILQFITVSSTMISSASTLLLATLVFNAASVFGAPIR